LKAGQPACSKGVARDILVNGAANQINLRTPDETREPEATEQKRPVTVRDLKPKSDPKGGSVCESASKMRLR